MEMTFKKTLMTISFATAPYRPGGLSMGLLLTPPLECVLLEGKDDVHFSLCILSAGHNASHTISR